MTGKYLISATMMCCAAVFGAVQDGPVITSQPQSQTNCAGANVSLSVEATGTEPLRYRWRLNDTNLFQGGNVWGTTNATLSITNLQKFNAGTYTVAVSNAWGSVLSQPAILEVIGPIQKLVNEASPNQTIAIPAGTYFDNVVIDKHLTLIGETPGVVVDGYQDRTVFTISSNATALVSNLVIRNGGMSGVVNLGSLTLESCMVTGNFGTYGAGISNAGQLLILNSTISANGEFYETIDGAGIYNASQAVLVVSNSVLQRNVGRLSGGALYNKGKATFRFSLLFDNAIEFARGGACENYGALALFDTQVVNNGAYLLGGIFSAGEFSASNCIFKGNDGGAGVRSPAAFQNGLGGTAAVTNCSFSGNEGMDGAVRNDGTMIMVSSSIYSNMIYPSLSHSTCGLRNRGALRMINCTVGENVSHDYPAYAVVNETNGMLSAEFCTFAKNRGVFAGVRNDGLFTLRSTIIAGNYDYYGAPRDCLGVFNSEGYNLIQKTNDCTVTGIVTGNILDRDPLLGPIRDNGGPTFTFALLPGSPAVDTGPTNNFPPVDQRGVARPQDGAGDCEAVSDIGAFERETKALLLTIQLLADAHVRIRLGGLADKNYGIQTSTTLVPPEWSSPIPMTNSSSPCIYEFEDGPMNPWSHRFYRAVELPEN